MSSVKEMDEKFVAEKKAFLKGFVIVAASVIIAIVLAVFTGIVGGIIGIIIVPIIAFVVLYFIWAPNDVFGTFPEEGFATIIVEGMGFKKLFLKLKYFGLDEEWNIVEENNATLKQREIRGMCLFLWPFQRRHVYRQKWTKYTEQGKSVFKEEVLRSVLVKSYFYYIGVLSAEDISVMPINIGLAVEMKIVNPVKAIFKIQNWYGSSANLIQGGVRDQIRKRNYLEWINLSGSVALGDYFETEMRPIIDKIKDDFGVQVVKIKVVQIEPSDKRYTEASTRKAVAEFEKQAIEVEARAKSYKRSTETIGPIIDMLVAVTGLTPAQIQEGIRNDLEGFMKNYGGILQEAKNLIEIQIAADKGKYIKIDTAGKNGRNNNPALDLMATFMAMSEKSKEPAKESSEKNISKEDSTKKKSKEELREETIKKYGLEK